MPESTSTSRLAPPQRPPGSPGSSSGSTPLVGGNRPIRDEEPTVISSEPPLAAPHVSESPRPGTLGGLLPGDRLEHFELLEYIGGGGMGRVFRARDTRLERLVALKVLAPGQAGDKDALARFRNEAQSAARLDHENVAQVFHVGEDHGLHYIAFEFIEGVNLRVLVHENGPLPVADAISYTFQVAEALAHAASRDVVHRDIKPSNVLVTPTGRAKLIDMGLARLHKMDTVAADLTASGVTLGTFDYISPEQARDPRNADVRSDVYSLGCTLFYMLAGRPPFPEGTVLQKLLQHQGDAPPDVRQFRPDTPDGLMTVLRRMMAKDPRDRYPAATELLDDLSSLARQLGLRPLSSSSRVWEAPPPPRISRWRHHMPWLAPTAALL
ncbi:MAG: serine/threonine-protein kinase, partial [Patescibacteria group bacterium]|nr:serine/threonine-protein kinase [Patescibacteria group bacterium]